MKRLDEVFNVWYGVNLELVNCFEDKHGIPFVSRTANINGIVTRIKEIPNIDPNPANTISIACGGSVLSTFFHSYPYYSGRDVYILEPKEKMNVDEMLLYCYIIEQNKYKYNYGRRANKTLKSLL